jgi:hypothetical protein
MSEEEDIDLLALQRQLDDAFETTRPRRAFEDELWLRIQTRRPFWQRLQDLLAGVVETLREVPAVPAAAVATVLILAIGLGILARSGVHLGVGGASNTTSATAPLSFGSNRAMAPNSFGRLPSVALYPGVPAPHAAGTPFAEDGSALAASPIPSNLYFGPATLSWIGQFPALSAPALVYRYQEPPTVLADQFATSLGAGPGKPIPLTPGYLGSYVAQDFGLSITKSWPAPPREPRFFLTPVGVGPSAGDPQTAATAFLATHSLLPTAPYTVAVVPFTVQGQSANYVRVQYLREFQLPDTSTAFLVGPLGDRYGTEVVFVEGRPYIADGPLPVNLDSASYPLITASQAIQHALASSPSGSQDINPKPVVKLDRVELVYALAVSGAQGFYEPAYLFSGTFQYQGQTMEKRVLVPAIDPSQLNS